MKTIVSHADIDLIHQLPARKSVLNLTDSEISDLLVWADIHKEYFSDKSPFERNIYGEWRDTEETKIPVLIIPDKKISIQQIREDIKSQTIFRGKLKNSDTQIDISVSRKGLEDTYAKGRKYYDKFFAYALYKIEDILKSSVLLDTVASEKNNETKAFNTVFMHKFYCICILKNRPYLLKTAIEEFAVVNSKTQFRFYNLQEIKLPRLLAFTQNRLALRLLDSDKISIADLFAIVKTFDKNFYTNSPDFHPRNMPPPTRKGKSMTPTEELLQSLINEVQELKRQNTELQVQLADVKHDVSEVKEDVTEVKEAQTKTNEKLDIIGAFQAAVQAGQPFEKSMHDLENVTKNLTQSKDTDKVTFYAKDSDSHFFTTDGECRTYDNTIGYNNAVQRAMESGEISVENGTAAYIPMMSRGGQPIGVIVAEKADGFEGVDFTKLAKDSQVMNIMSQAFDKKIADDKAELDISGAKNEIALDKYVKRELVHSISEQKPVTIMRVSAADIPSEAQESKAKELARAIEKSGRTSPQDIVFRMDSDKDNITFLVMLNCTEQRAQKNEDLLRIAVEQVIGNDNCSIDIHQIESDDINPHNAAHIFENELAVLDRTEELDFSFGLDGETFYPKQENDIPDTPSVTDKKEKTAPAESLALPETKKPLGEFFKDTIAPYFDKVMSIANDIKAKEEQHQTLAPSL